MDDKKIDELAQVMIGKQATTIDNLNDKLLTSIFCHLPPKDLIKIERVCKRWRDVSLKTWNVKTDNLWLDFNSIPSLKERIRLTFRTFSNYISSLRSDAEPPHECTFMSKCQSRISTRISPYRTVDTSQVVGSVLQRSGQFLTQITFSFKGLTYNEDIFVKIALHCPHLRELNLCWMNLSAASVKTLAEKCGNIEWLRLGHVTGNFEEELAHLFESNKNLVGFHVHNTHVITGMCLTAIGSERFETLEIEYCDRFNLNHLRSSERLTRCLKKFYLETDDNGVLSHLDAVSVLTNLIYLSLYSTKIGVTGRTLLEIGQKCRLLQEADLCLDLVITNSKATCKMPQSKNFADQVNVTLDEASFTDSGLDAVFDLPQLKRLAIADQVDVRRKAWSQRQREIPNLEELHLVEFMLTCMDVINIVKLSPKLERLILEDCELPFEKLEFLKTLCKTVKKRDSEVKLRLRLESEKELSVDVVFYKSSYEILLDFELPNSIKGIET